MTEQPNREVAVLNAALELRPAERAAYLDQACAGDVALRRQVEALLLSHEQAEGFLDAPPAGLDFKRTVKVNTPLTEKPGDRIGRYKLLQQIGEGGCGVVYMAEQEEPVRRRVALKVIKLGMDTKQVIARFEAERQALALMDHSNIAKVLDAGATETGRPYFVMELVRGIKITDFCDENKLSTADRLKLFIQVCQAIQHAHQKGVIHRDIKPSNILVTINDGVPVPKVIDFGIAKATAGRLTDHTLFTAFEQFIGTPAYMSPEQAVMTSLDIDTRSDIYSLGVLLYELLTGKTPFDQKELLAAGLDEMRRTIREEEPPKPSTRLDTMAADALTTTAKQHHTDAPKLVYALRGDLDWIAMKCLEKDRARRYETANGLASDIQRHLNCEPIVARPPSRLYEFQKTVRRHKFGFAAAAAIITALSIGLGVSTRQFVQKNRAYQRTIAAEQEQTRLRQHAEQSATQEAQQRQRAEDLAEQNRENLYAASINLAQQVFEEGDVGRVNELLDSLRPKEGQSDLRGFEWYYLWRLCHSARANLVGHPAPVRTLAFSPDGSTVATAGDEPIIRLWNVTTGQERGSLEGHSSWISSLAYSPDKKLIASGGAEKIVRLWDTATGKQVFGFPAASDDITCVTFSAKGGLLAAATGELATGTGTPTTRYVRAGKGGEVKIWNAETHAEIAAFKAHPEGVLSLAFAPDGRMLATGGAGNSVKIWDPATGQMSQAFTNLTGPAFSLAFAPGGSRLAAGIWNPYSNAAEIRFWDTTTWKETAGLKSRAPPVACIAFAPDGHTLASSGIDRVVRLWDLSTGLERATFKGHTGPVWALAFSPDGETLASAGWDRTSKLWDVARKQEQDVHGDTSCYTAAFTPDGELVACAGAGHVDVWEVKRGKKAFRLPLKSVSDISVTLSHDGKTLAAAGSDSALYLFDLASHELRHRLEGHTEKIWCLAFSPDDRIVATGSGDTTLKLWDVATGTVRDTLAGHTSTVSTLAFAPDGRTLVSGSWEQMIVWDLASAKALETLNGAAARLAIAPNGRFFAAGTAVHGIVIRDFGTKQELGRITGHKDEIYKLAFSADGKTLATASWDGTAKLWRVPQGQLLLTIRSGIGVTWCAEFSPDGRSLVVSSGSARAGQIALLHAATKEETERPEPTVPIDTVPKLGKYPVAAELLRGTIDPRASDAPPELLDLSHHYNGSLTAGWIPSSFYGSSVERNLGDLPRGVQTLGDVRFDIRGVVQLAGKSLNGYLSATYPHDIKPIEVNQQCRRLHFLHGTGWRVLDGTAIGRYVIHYADGLQIAIPIVYGENVRDWWFSPVANEPTPHAVVAWTGQNAAVRSRGMAVRLYNFTWENPHPESPITDLDFISLNTQSSPFLIAVTAELKP